MFRVIVLAAHLLLINTFLSSTTSAQVAMKGVLLHFASIDVALSETDINAEIDAEIDALNSTEIVGLPDKWNCDNPAGVVGVRGMQFCQTMVDGPASVKRKTAMVRYRILVEKGLEDLTDGFVARVEDILGEDSGWRRNGLHFTRVVDDYDITILLAVPASIDRLCRPLQTEGWLSCAFARRAMINATRWQNGALTWGRDIEGYHHYLINHEVGHLLGLRHADCPEIGSPAPIMQQQTIFLNGCVANGAATPKDIAMLNRVMSNLEDRLAGNYKRHRRYRRSRAHSRRYRRRTRLARRASYKRRSRRHRRKANAHQMTAFSSSGIFQAILP